jgi:hypothetical protein
LGKVLGVDQAGLAHSLGYWRLDNLGFNARIRGWRLLYCLFLKTEIYCKFRRGGQLQVFFDVCAVGEVLSEFAEVDFLVEFLLRLGALLFLGHCCFVATHVSSFLSMHLLLLDN